MRKTPGLRYDKARQQWIIDKRVPGRGRIFERTGFTENQIKEAQKRYFEVMNGVLDEVEREHKGMLTFAEAAARHLKEAIKRSVVRDEYALRKLLPVIGHRVLEEIHQGTLQAYIDSRREEGAKSGTVARELTVVRRILTLAHRVWRTKQNKPYLAVLPSISSPDWEDESVPYPLSWDEQKLLLRALPDNLATMALFAVNTGLREQGVCWLRWEWEQRVPELNTSVFVIPGSPIKFADGTWPGEKNKEDQLVVLNRITRSVVNDQRGNQSPYVFDLNGRRRSKMHTTAWNNAWKNAGLPTDPEYCQGPHNLKHTFGRRLRAAGINHETRKVLLHHTNGDITTHYSPAAIQELIDAVESIAEMKPVTLLSKQLTAPSSR